MRTQPDVAWQTMARRADTLEETIRAYAHSLGFGLVEILAVDDLEQNDLSKDGEHLRDWLSRGYHADMTWMADYFDKRVAPQTLMEGTRSIIVAGINYHWPNDNDTGTLEKNGSQIKIAQYARGRDYHKVIRKKLKKLLSYIQTLHPEAQGRPVTDSAPALEKPLAVRAGLGWQGKNSLLIHPKMGSYFLLGELLLTLDLKSTATPMQTMCGTCTRCIDACPTQAITEPAVVDSNRCIAYWTIESKAEQLPEEISDNLQGWVFGCDICQEVCPWNIKFATPTTEPAFYPRAELLTINATELLNMSQDSFSSQFTGNPLRRAGYEGIKRNVLAEIGRQRTKTL